MVQILITLSVKWQSSFKMNAVTTMFWFTVTAYYSCYKPGDKSRIRKVPDCNYDKRKYMWPFETQIFRNSKPKHGGDCIHFE
jgi:hypothetical protein